MNGRLVGAINASPVKAYIVATGGGATFIGDYLTIPGGSATIIKFELPYAMAATDDFLGKAPDKYVSEECALKFAAKAFLKAQKLQPNTEVVGIGLSASLATSNEREGRTHKIFASMHEMDKTILVNIEMKQGLNRANEEVVAKNLILELLASTVDRGDLRAFLNTIPTLIDSKIVEVPAGDKKRLFKGDKVIGLNKVENLMIYPGSFNPITKAHLEIGNLAEDITQVPVTLEISALNFDKPPLDYISMEQREVDAAVHDFNLVFSNAPLFTDKIPEYMKYADNLILVMGYDTFERVVTHHTFEEFIELCTDYQVELMVMGDITNMLNLVRPDTLRSRLNDMLIKHDKLKNFKMDVRASDIRKQMLD